MEIIQIIGKGGIGREVATYWTGPYEMYENDCEGINPTIATVIAIGDGAVRKRISEKLNYLTWAPLNLTSRIVNRYNKIGDGTILCPGTIVTCNVTIGIHCLINLNCTIGHDCVIGDFVTMSPGANVSGNVTIGNGCYIGTNAVIREKISICDNVVIGAGGVVVKNITEPGVYVGNPVKKIG